MGISLVKSKSFIETTINFLTEAKTDIMMFLKFESLENFNAIFLISDYIKVLKIRQFKRFLLKNHVPCLMFMAILIE